MKKILGIVVLGLLLSGNAYAGWFDKDKIKATKCYNISVHNSYKEKLKSIENQKKNGSPLILTKWEWELNLKEKIAYRTTILNGKLNIAQFKIKISTDEYIIASDSTGDTQFDLKNEVVIIPPEYGEPSEIVQCKFG